MSASACLSDPALTAWQETLPLERPTRRFAWLARPAVREGATYGLAVVLCLGWLVGLTDLHKAYLSAPLVGADASLYQGLIQNVIDSGWYYQGTRVGAPFAADARDFPMPDVLHFAAFRVLACFTSNAALIYNLYLLLGFPLATVTCVYAMRQLGVSRGVALGIGLLFAFLPFHLWRTPHVFLIAYYPLPLITLVLVRLYSGESLFRAAPGSTRWGKVLRPLGTIAICAMMGLGGAYYVFFACFFAVVAGLGALVRQRRLANLAATLGVIALMGGFFLAAMAPMTVPGLRPEKNRLFGAEVKRSAEQILQYGLRLSHLFLPVINHRVPVLREIKEKFMRDVPHESEGWDSEAMGLLGSLGLLALLARVFWRTRDSGSNLRLDALAILTLGAILLAESDGFGGFFNCFVSPWIRCYNRISIYVALFSLIAFGILLDRLLATRFAQRCPSLVRLGFVLALTTLGILDMNPTPVPFLNHQASATTYRHDRHYFKVVEEALPAGGSVFEMPFMMFPEVAPVHRLPDYQLFTPYVHTRKLRWSYGSPRGQRGDLWNRLLEQLPLPKRIEAITLAGFDAILVDRFGYVDNGQALEAALGQQLKVTPLVSHNQRYATFPLRIYKDSLVGSASAEAQLALREQALHRTGFFWYVGFSPEMQTSEGKVRWCTSYNLLLLANTGINPVVMDLELTCGTPQPQPHELHLNCKNVLAHTVTLTSQAQTIKKRLEVPPGGHLLSLSFIGPACPEGKENLGPCFWVRDVSIRETVLEPQAAER